MISGTITRVDRTNGLCYYLPHPLPTQALTPAMPLEELRAIEHSATWMGRLWPCPLTDWYFTDDGQVGIGPCNGSPEELVYDHFLYNDATTPVAGDTPWDEVVVGAGVGAATDGVASLGLGVKRLRSRNATNDNTYMQKSGSTILAGQAPAFWMPQRLVIIEGNTSILDISGVRNGADTAGVEIWATTLLSITEWTQRSVGTSGTGVGQIVGLGQRPFVVGELLWFDTVWSPDEFAASWCEGDGPYWTENGTPGSAQSFHPHVFCQTLTNANRAFGPDFYGLYALPHAHNPRLLGLDQAGQ